MAGTGVIVACALGATAFFSLATALKHRTAGLTPPAASKGSVTGFLVATARHPLWLAGIAADIGGLALQVTALHLGALAVVQPLMITALLFSLLVNHKVAGTRVSKREAIGALVLVTALAAFLLFSGASSPAITGPAQQADPEPALAIGVAAVIISVGFIMAARRVPQAGAAALLGVSVGIIYACTAALIKSCSNVALSQGWLALVTSWQLYLLLALGAGGLALSQLAFQAGPLRTSLPAIATVDPLLSIALGVFVYGEHLRPGTLAIVGELACLLALTASAIYLSRLTGVQEAPERTGLDVSANAG